MNYTLCCRRVAASGSYFWGGLVRIDILNAPVSASLAFYGPKALTVHALPLLDDSCDHLNDVSVATHNVSDGVNHRMEVCAAPSGTGSAGAIGSKKSRGGVAGRSAEAGTSGSGREPQLLFGEESVRDRGGLRIAREVRSCRAHYQRP